MMTRQDIFQAIADAPTDKKIQTAEKMLAQYDGDDKTLIAPDVLSHAALFQTFPHADWIDGFASD